MVRPTFFTEQVHLRTFKNLYSYLLGSPLMKENIKQMASQLLSTVYPTIVIFTALSITTIPRDIRAN